MIYKFPVTVIRSFPRFLEHLRIMLVCFLAFPVKCQRTKACFGNAMMWKIAGHPDIVR